MTDRIKAYFLLDITSIELAMYNQEWLSAKVAMMRDNLFVEMSKEEADFVVASLG